MPASIAEQNNNPCNIKFSKDNKWRGLDDSGFNKNPDFCKFVKPAFGFRAFFALAYHYYNYCNVSTIEKFIKRYAPSSENNTSLYISYLRKRLNKEVLPNLTSYSYWIDFALAVSRYESGTEWSIEIVQEGYIMFILDYYI